MLKRICLFFVVVENVLGKCQEANVFLDGKIQSTTRERDVSACESKCSSMNCDHWSFRNGSCAIMKPNDPGRKVGELGAVHGTKLSNNNQCNNKVSGITCSYTLTKKPVVCLFPFIGEVPGNMNSSRSRDSCLRTKRGKYWCATKLSLDNKLLSTSDQTQDIDCGLQVSPQGSFRCMTSSCPNMTLVGQHIAKLEQENRLLKEQGCNVTSSLNQSNNKNTSPSQKPTLPSSPTPAPKPSTPASAADPVLGAFTEKLLALDENNARRFITFNQGCTTQVGRTQDCSSQPLFTNMTGTILNLPIYQKLKALYENYLPDTLKVEDHTSAEQTEEIQFLDEVMKTRVMEETYSFLKQEKYFKGTKQEFRNLLNELWFSVYSRGMRIKGSSGFEHVFLGEKKEGKVQGFHNWLYFFFLEKRKQLNYLGHWKNIDFGGRGNGLAFTFKWGAEQKAFGSMIIGTSPEIELAIYTTCWLAKGEQKCPVSLGGKKVDVEVHTFSRPGGKNFIASSFFNF